MRRPVAEIEGARSAVFKGVAIGADMVEVHFRAAGDELGHRFKIAGGILGSRATEVLEEGAVADDGDFEGLGDAGEPVAVGEGAEEFEVVEDREGGGEGADGVFSEIIDGIFDADAGIVLGEHGGGDTDQAEATVDEGGGESDGIEDGSAADDDDVGLAVHAEFEELAEDGFDVSEAVFGGLTRWNGLRGCGEFEGGGVGVKVGADFSAELGLGREHMRIHVNHAPVFAIFAAAARGFQKDGVGRGKEVVGENDRKLPVDADVLQVGVRGVHGWWRGSKRNGSRQRQSAIGAASWPWTGPGLEALWETWRVPDSFPPSRPGLHFTLKR